MALDVKVGSFTSASGVNSINVGFKPKLVILLGKYANSDYPANTKESYCYGASTGPGTDCVVHQDNREDIWGKIGGVISGYSIYLANMVTGVELAAQIYQLTDTGFDINFTTHAKSETIYYLALGGSDITNSSVGSFDFPTGSTYSQNLGYRPDALILFGIVGTPVGTDRSKPPISIGFYDGTTQYSEGHSERSDGSADRGGWKLGAINAMPTEGTTGTVTSTLYEVTAAFTSTGFDLTKTVGGTTQAAHCFIAIKGPQCKVGTKDTATAAGADSITGIGFTTSAVLTTGDGRDNVSGNYGKPNREFYGVSDATSNFAVGSVSQQDNYPDRSWRDGTRSISFQDYSNGVITGATITGFAADTISLNWDTVSASIRTFGYLAIGAAPTAGNTVSASRTSSVETQQGIKTAAISRFECARALLSAHLCGMESIAMIDATASSWYCALAEIGATGSIRWESTGPVLVSTSSSMEVSMRLLQAKPSEIETLTRANKASIAAYETVARVVGALSTSYEVRGIATTPVSTAVAVAIEALQSARRSSRTGIASQAMVDRLSRSPIDALRHMGRSGISAIEALSMLAGSAAVPFESDGVIVAATYHDIELLLSASQEIEAMLRRDINLH